MKKLITLMVLTAPTFFAHGAPAVNPPANAEVFISRCTNTEFIVFNDGETTSYSSTSAYRRTVWHISRGADGETGIKMSYSERIPSESPGSSVKISRFSKLTVTFDATSKTYTSKSEITQWLQNSKNTAPIETQTISTARYKLQGQVTHVLESISDGIDFGPSVETEVKTDEKTKVTFGYDLNPRSVDQNGKSGHSTMSWNCTQTLQN